MNVSMICKSGLFTAGVWCMLAAIASAQQTKQSTEPGQVKPSQLDSSNGKNRNQSDSPRARQRGTEQQTRAREDQPEAGTGPQGDQLNYAIAACMLDNNQAEVALAKIAVERATNDDVKTFAKQMVKDHGQMVDMLQKFVGSHEPTDRRSQIDRKISQRCAESMRKELESKSGHDFDACYVGSQIADHMHMLAALSVLSDETTGELQEIVNGAQPVVEKHYKHAKELMEKTDSREARRDLNKDRSK